MGCDIHCHVETKQDGKWKYVEEYDISRYYDLFSILANVRNGYGFAGVRTGNGIVPIDNPRGLPHDVSFEAARESENWGADGHSHSFLTLDEILSFDWTQTVQKVGQLHWKEYTHWVARGKFSSAAPESYADHISGPNIIYLQDNPYGKISLPLGILPENCVVNYTWTEPYHNRCKEFWYSIIPQLLRLGAPTNVRLVFWFDN